MASRELTQTKLLYLAMKTSVPQITSALRAKHCFPSHPLCTHSPGPGHSCLPSLAIWPACDKVAISKAHRNFYHTVRTPWDIQEHEDKESLKRKTPNHEVWWKRRKRTSLFISNENEERKDTFQEKCQKLLLGLFKCDRNTQKRSTKPDSKGITILEGSPYLFWETVNSIYKILVLHHPGSLLPLLCDFPPLKRKPPGDKDFVCFVCAFSSAWNRTWLRVHTQQNHTKEAGIKEKK